MSDQKSAAASRPESPQGEKDRAAEKLPSRAEPSTPAAGKQLTPEEQMALYEKDLKENDWGHQPC